jgi:PAS domain S-box-containing protein
VAQQPIELILVRHLASLLAIPVFVVDGDGDLVYFNEPAEGVLGRSFADVRSMPFAEWTTAFAASHEGERLDPAELPLAIAVRRREPSTSQFEIVDANGHERHISASAFPLIGQHGRLLGAVAMFWEVPTSG